MRVLWFSVSPSLYSSNMNNQGLGWIASLERIVRSDRSIELGIAFEHEDELFKTEKKGVVYYPINGFKRQKDCKKRKYYADIEEQVLIPLCQRVIDDFRPDVIHVFGSEWCFGLVQEITTIPVVIHMQGSYPPYQNAIFPPGYSWNDEHNRIPWWNFRWKWRHEMWRKRSLDIIHREERILRGCKYFMGRTEWDYALTKLYSPNSKYYKCWEALRPIFLSNTEQWTPHYNSSYVIVSTGPSRLKGMDVILKTANLLQRNTNINFEWRIIGADRNNLREHELKWGINAEDVSVVPLGTLGCEDVYKHLMQADIYVLPTYADNSPNAICEAMCLGMPIVSTFAGGVPSFI